MKAAITSVVMMLLFVCGPAYADDHPYAGVWGEAGAEEVKKDPAFFGENACYNKFTEQLPDGHFRYYLVDHAKWIDEQKIEYLLAQEGTCTMDQAGKTEKCVGNVVGEKQSEWFIAYEKIHGNSVRASYYENAFYFEKRFNGEPLVRHRCPFDISKMKSYISGRTIADCATRCRAFAKSESKEFEAMTSAVKAAAH